MTKRRNNNESSNIGSRFLIYTNPSASVSASLISLLVLMHLFGVTHGWNAAAGGAVIPSSSFNKSSFAALEWQRLHLERNRNRYSRIQSHSSLNSLLNNHSNSNSRFNRIDVIAMNNSQEHAERQVQVSTKEQVFFKKLLYTASETELRINSMTFSLALFISTAVAITPLTMTMTMQPQSAWAQDITLLTPQNLSPQTSISTGTGSTTTNGISTSINKSKYYNIMQSGTDAEVQYVNERLLDHAVGTINTMFYDNTGGARFTTKDMYDRWKIMRVYAKEGADGVNDLTSSSSVAKVVNANASLNGNANTDVNGNGNGATRTTNTNTNAEQRKMERGDIFIPQLFMVEGEQIKLQKQHFSYQQDSIPKLTVPAHAFDNRENAVASLKWLVSTLEDPYSKYLTREELQQELKATNNGFLGLGAIVELPSKQGRGTIIGNQNHYHKGNSNGYANANSQITTVPNTSYLTVTRVANLPLITAIAPDSPAERAGIVVGDRIAAVGSDKFIGLGRDEVVTRLELYSGADNYIGHPELTIAKPQLKSVVGGGNGNSGGGRINQVNVGGSNGANENVVGYDDDFSPGREELLGYKLSRLRLPTANLEPYKPYKRINDNVSNMAVIATSEKTSTSTTEQANVAFPSGLVPPASAAVTTKPNIPISGGDAIVHWELLRPNDSIFGKYKNGIDGGSGSDASSAIDKIGYIRLTRFSRLSTAGYSKAIEELEKAGAQSYIIDVRNNYGGIIQESMLTAATLLRDPHTVLCYTLNSRGGFTPHDAEEYIVDVRYPGYFLSSEPKTSTFDQVKRDNPEFVASDGGWVPPSSYASIHEQRTDRKYKRPTGIAFLNPFQNRQVSDNKSLEEIKQLKAQKKMVILMNEGTASAAEVFVSSLHDNGRAVALVGTRTYGKGLIQHTFPMPDGGGLRLTVAEYLTPALQHVTKVGGAQYENGQFVGGGIRPDIYCPSSQGIPSNIGADICVGLAVDALDDANTAEIQMVMNTDVGGSGGNKGLAGRQGGIDGGSFRRRTLNAGIVRVS